MTTWNGGAMLVRHKCGCRMWIENLTFYAFAIIGSEWWRGDVLTECPQCGSDLTQFSSKQWTEA